jgi:hypothetical protein
MILCATYRRTALLMAGLVLVFAAGIPVVLAACPMAGEGGPVCCSCIAPAIPGTHAIARTADSSCCTTVIAAKGNFVEYLAPRDAARPVLADGFAGLPVRVPVLGPLTAPHLHVGSPGHPPPWGDDRVILLHSILV